MQHDTNPSGEKRRKLTDILNGQADSLRSQWETTEAAADFAPLPAGTYTARVISGELINANSGTPGYKITFKIIDGDYVRRHLWHDCWLTPAAMPMTKRDLAKLGVTDVEQLEQPLPQGIRVSAKVALRRDDDGSEYNRVKSFEVVGVDDDPTADDDFAPDESETESTTDHANAEGETTDAGTDKTSPAETSAGDNGGLIDTTPRRPWAKEAGR